MVAFATPEKFESKHKQSLPNKRRGKLNIARTPPIPTFSCVRSHKMAQEVTSCQQTNRFFQTKLLRVSSKRCLHSAASSRVQLPKMHCMFVVGQCSLDRVDTYWQRFVEFASESKELMKRVPVRIIWAYFLIKQKQILFEPFCVVLSQTSLKFASVCLCLYEWAILGCKKGATSELSIGAYQKWVASSQQKLRPKN